MIPRKQSRWLRWVSGAVVLLLGVSNAAADGKGSGKGDGQSRAGRQDCGEELVVVLADGARRQYVPAASLLADFTPVQINQGERPRSAVKISEVLASLGGSWMEALDCDNKSVHLPSGLPFEGNDYLVVTGRGVLKVIREVRPGRYSNVAQSLRKLTVHQPAPPGEQR